ncbi:MAG: hypothetical protein H6756_09430 [Candidatus Omnitrophica bacterium]|nr:hypothetical protein [Candidatus Omnitrophota bacterium]
MDDKNFHQNLYRYLDGEMSPEEKNEFEAAMKDNPLSQSQLENEQRFDQVIRRHMIQEEAPYELRERIIDKLQYRSPFERLRETAWFAPLASGLITAFIAVIFFAVLAHTPREFTAFAQGIDTHIEHLHGTYQAEFLTDDIDAAVHWFDEKLDFAVIRPHIAPDKAKLIGARIIQINGRKAAYFMYDVQGHPLSAFVMDMNGEPLERIRDRMLRENDNARIYARNMKGFQAVLCYHRGNDTGCMLVTDMTQDELLPLMG